MYYENFNIEKKMSENSIISLIVLEYNESQNPSFRMFNVQQSRNVQQNQSFFFLKESFYDRDEEIFFTKDGRRNSKIS